MRGNIYWLKDEQKNFFLKDFFFKSTDKEKINTKCIIRFDMYVMLYIRSCLINWLNLFYKEIMNSLKRIVTNKGTPALQPHL